MLNKVLDETFSSLDEVLETSDARIRVDEFGAVRFVGQGIARVGGLPRVRSEELVLFSGDLAGMVFNVDPHEVGIILMDESERIAAGSEVRRTGRTLDVPVGESLLGRVVDAIGRPLDSRAAIRAVERRPIERDAPAIMDRLPVTVPLQTGIKVLDALIPVGRGQRELILGDRQTGTTAFALDTIINQMD